MTTSSDSNSIRGDTGEGVPNKKMNDQKQSKEDGTCEIVSDILGRLDISNNDELLFQDPPPREDCPICMLPMPHANAVCGIDLTYMPCCGKTLCSGCMLTAEEEMSKGVMKSLCPFCRVSIHQSGKEIVKSLKKRMKMNDSESFFELGTQYSKGGCGLPQNMDMALKLFHQSAELDYVCAHFKLAYAYYHGRSVAKDTEKAMHHYRLAAIGGHECARYNLGSINICNGNIERSMRHFIIAAKAGCDTAVKAVGEGYKAGYVTKDEYTKTLRVYQSSCLAMKSEQRTKAWLLDEEDKSALS